MQCSFSTKQVARLNLLNWEYFLVENTTPSFLIISRGTLGWNTRFYIYRHHTDLSLAIEIFFSILMQTGALIACCDTHFLVQHIDTIRIHTASATSVQNEQFSIHQLPPYLSWCYVFKEKQKHFLPPLHSFLIELLQACWWLSFLPWIRAATESILDRTYATPLTLPSCKF